jgi:ATP-dependent Zn protease
MQEDPFFTDDSEPRVVIVEQKKAVDILGNPNYVTQNSESTTQKTSPQDDFYSDLQRDLVQSDENDKNEDESWWWFTVMSVFLFILFVILIVYLVSKMQK